jgi:hypothetical protein
VQVKINGRGPFQFLFDTGSMSVLSLDLAKELDLKLGDPVTVEGFGGPAAATSAVVDSINLGDLTMDRTTLTVIDGGPFVKGRLSGMLGREFLAPLVTEVDYEHGVLRFFDPKTFVYTGNGARLPITVHENQLMSVPARVFGNQAQIQIDSGSERSLVLFPAFVKAHRLHSDLEAVTGYGFGGMTRAMMTRAPLLEIENLTIKDPVVELSLDSTGVETGPADGNMGGPLLREFTCIYDLPHRFLYLEPNAWYGKPDLTDLSGVVLEARGRAARVLFVYPGSPAAAAGIVAGDELNDATGRPLSSDQWHDLLDGASGAAVDVTVTHAARERKAHFALKRYL